MRRYISPEPPFTVDGVTMTRHPERAVCVNRIASAFVILTMSVLLGMLAALITTLVHLLLTRSRDWHELLDWWHPAMTALALLPVALYAWRFDRIKAAWRFRGYHLGTEELYLRTGLLTRKLTVLAYARIQEVNVVSDPIQRHFKLATVTITTAGGSDAIADVDPQTAQRLREQLTELARERRLPV
ncbi:PH domain-containing protein [Streptomyces sp. NBC_00470]|uniref:PH domain-containing protein n=1 Tax=Streptomyces sp. NBC_00470 TaxID=2975753 RepID=UPI002F90B0B3